MVKLIVALMVLVPAVALAGGGKDYQYEQNTAPKVVVNIPADDGNGAIIAAVVAGVFSFGGILVLRNRNN